MQWDGHGNTNYQLTLKKPIVDPNIKLNQFTICGRFYLLAYNQHAHIIPFGFWDQDWVDVETNGYTEGLSKHFYVIIYPPGQLPFDYVVWNFGSNKIAESKTEWSYMRSSPQGMNALEWHNLCYVYNVPGKNTGMVLNGEIVANRNHSDFWANDDNFYTSYSLQPVNVTSWR